MKTVVRHARLAHLWVTAALAAARSATATTAHGAVARIVTWTTFTSAARIIRWWISAVGLARRAVAHCTLPFGIGRRSPFLA
jgi:hypothetical protein